MINYDKMESSPLFVGEFKRSSISHSLFSIFFSSLNSRNTTTLQIPAGPVGIGFFPTYLVQDKHYAGLVGLQVEM